MSTQLELLQSAVLAAVDRIISSGQISGDAPTSIVLERPKNREHGDYATSIALQLAKAAGRNPREIAELVAAELTGIDSIS